MKVVGIIQARMGSTRLPGKVLLPFCGSTPLEMCYRRLARAETVDEVVVATTNSKANQPIAEHCQERGMACFLWHGPEHNVYDRTLETAWAREADVIVDVTSDCPFVDSSIVDAVVRRLGRGRGAYEMPNPPYDYVSNVWPARTWPDGMDVQVYTTEAMEAARKEHGLILEHSGMNLPLFLDDLRIGPILAAPPHLYTPDLRLTLDTMEDLRFMAEVFEKVTAFPHETYFTYPHEAYVSSFTLMRTAINMRKEEKT